MTAAPKIFEVPFHIGDFLSGTLSMDAVEIGAYWLLCVAHYQAGVEGLPDNDRQLARIARVGGKAWLRLRPRLEEKFFLNEGRWRHKKIIDVLLKAAEKSAVAQTKSLKRWNGDHAAALPQDCRGNPNHQPLTDKVIKPEGRISSARVSGGGYDVERQVRFPVLLKAKARAAELNRDFAHLCALYNGFVDQRGMPGDADEAFLAWIEKFTKGKAL